jgi:hypothetical protein
MDQRISAYRSKPIKTPAAIARMAMEIAGTEKKRSSCSLSPVTTSQMIDKSIPRLFGMRLFPNKGQIILGLTCKTSQQQMPA